MGFRFLHLADLHLETSFGGLEATRSRLRRAPLEAFVAAVDLALERDLHAVLVAGDAFDDPHLSLATEIAFVEQIHRLTAAGTWFLLACGNHDPGGDSFQTARLGIEDDPRVHIFRRPAPERVVVTDSDNRSVGLVCGAGHATPAEATNLAAGIGRRADANSIPAVGLLHTHVESARSAGEHDRYAVSHASDFARSDFAYWALGHIHLRQQVVPDEPVYYAGNLQGRNPRERGPKGGWLVDAEPGRPAEPSFVRLGPVRWARRRFDVPRETDRSSLVNALAEEIHHEREWPEEEVVVELVLEGTTELARSLRAACEIDGATGERNPYARHGGW